MQSIVDYTYPQMVWRNGEKYLWNAIHKKALKNRPEERVRLRTIEYLMQAGWSQHRISTEEGIGQMGDKAMRTDIICYNQQFEPRVLIECKAESIPISAKTATQAARYNQKVGAPYVLMTNGISDFWYYIENESSKIVQLKKAPDFLHTHPVKPDYYFEDWKQRGFVGSKAVPKLRLWYKEMLPQWWYPEEASSIRFLNFNQGTSDTNLNHYYRIHSVSANRRIAATILNTAFGGNRLVAILNDQKENKCVLEINMDLLFEKEKKNCSLYSEAGIKTFNLNDYFDLSATVGINQIFEDLEQFFLDWFS